MNLTKKYKTILVTGGAGFIGSNLCEELVKDKDLKVFSLDNYSTGKIENHIEGVEYVTGHTKDVLEIIKEKIDLVFHLGEYSRVTKSFDEPEKVFEYNTIGTQKILEFCIKNKAKLIYAGSSTKFCDDNTGNVQSPYAWSKYINTEYVKRYSEWYNLEYAITYFSNVYGEREIESGEYSTLIAKYIYNYKNNFPIEVNNPGTQIRNFTYVKDTIKGLILVGNSGRGDDYIIASNKSYTILDIAKMFTDKYILKGEVRGDRKGPNFSTAKMKTEFDFYCDSQLEKYIQSHK